MAIADTSKSQNGQRYSWDTEFTILLRPDSQYFFSFTYSIFHFCGKLNRRDNIQE